MSTFFEVVFTVKEEELTDIHDSWNRKKESVIIKEQDYGMDVIDQIRTELQLPNLPFDRFPPHISALNFPPKVQLKEEDIGYIRCCPHFKSVSNLIVYMPISFLKEYLIIEADTWKESDGRIRSLHLKWKIKREQILEDWQEADFPLEWGFNEKDTEIDEST